MRIWLPVIVLLLVPGRIDKQFLLAAPANLLPQGAADANDKAEKEAAARRIKLMNNPVQLEGRLLDGRNLRWAGYRGKVVLIDFWATWCKPCMVEIANIKENFAKYHERGFEVVGISLDQMPRDQLAAFVMKEQIPWAICRDADSPLRMADYYGVKGIPALFLVGRDGKIASLDARGPNLGPEIEKALAANIDDSKKKRGPKILDDSDASKPKRAPPVAAVIPPLRDWSDVTGKFNTKARFRGLAGKIVKLELESGQTISVPLEKLSEDDRDFILKRRK